MALSFISLSLYKDSDPKHTSKMWKQSLKNKLLAQILSVMDFYPFHPVFLSCGIIVGATCQYGTAEDSIKPIHLL